MATKYQESYEIDEIISTIHSIDINSDIDKRDKAMISLCLLTTPRIAAMQTAKVGSIKHFKQYKSWAFIQDPNVVHTKYSRNITSYFIGSDQNLYDNVINWMEYLKESGFTDRDPLFPKSMPSFNNVGTQTDLMVKSHIKSQTTIRDIFRKRFAANDLHYYKPHTFRHTIVRHVISLHDSAEFIAALDVNMRHTMNSGVIIFS